MNPATTIYPTFECFNDALEFISYIAIELQEMVDDHVLVHSICVTKEGREYAHAWVEDIKDKRVIFSGIYMGKKIYFSAPFKDYFEAYQVKESIRYTVLEALKQNRKTIHYGPWKKKYKALCGTGEQTILGGGQMNNVAYLGSLPTIIIKQPKKGKQE